MASVYAINKGTSRSEDLLAIIHQLFWLTVKYKLKLSASHIAGGLNIASDRVSQLHSIQEACEARALLSDCV
jgi:hypothetical protein